MLSHQSRNPVKKSAKKRMACSKAGGVLALWLGMRGILGILGILRAKDGMQGPRCRQQNKAGGVLQMARIGNWLFEWEILGSFERF